MILPDMSLLYNLEHQKLCAFCTYFIHLPFLNWSKKAGDFRGLSKKVVFLYYFHSFLIEKKSRMVYNVYATLGLDGRAMSKNTKSNCDARSRHFRKENT